MVSFIITGWIHLSQSTSPIKNTIENTGLVEENGRATPYNSTTELMAPQLDDKAVRETALKYASIVGEFSYLADNTRPYLAYITGKLASATRCPTERHWVALRIAFRYLRHT